MLGLALIVFVRTFLSFALEIELDGVEPWGRAEMERCYDTDGEGRGTARDGAGERDAGGCRS